MALPLRPGRDRHEVAILLPDPCHAFEMSVACEIFGLDRSEFHDPWYGFTVASIDGSDRVRSESGFTFLPEHGPEAAADADTVIIPLWPGLEEPPDDDLLDLLRGVHERGGRLMSFCSGAFALGHTGLLDGQPATTHWMYSERFEAAFPEVAMHPDSLYVEAEGGVFTSAGTAAAIDLCLYVVRRDLGAEVANKVARRMVVPPHRDGGQAQFVDAPISACDVDDPLKESLDWALEHLDQPLSVDVLARRAAMSPRTFARRFRQVTGETPLQWLLHQRVLLAQRLLETTEDSIEEIATQCGFGSAAALREHFVRRTHTSPTAYRRTFTCAQPA
jgi:AraC family transcriptional regulator, transcriptional activator FtrA